MLAWGVAAVLSACLTLPRPPLSQEGAVVNPPPGENLRAFQDGNTDDVSVYADPTVLRLQAAQQSEPLPNFEVAEVSLSSASIHETMQAIIGRQKLSWSVARALDGTPSQFGAVTAYGIAGPFPKVLESLARSMGFFYSYRDGILHIVPEEQFFFTLPPVEDAFSGIAATLQAMGARGVSLDKGARAVSFRASRQVLDAIRGYLDYIRENRAIVTYDIWIYEVILSDQNAGGIAWNKLGSSIANDFGGNSATLSGTATQPNDGLGVSLIFNARRFNLDLFMKFLRSQGTLRTLSQPRLALLSGTKGQIKAGRKVVYVSQVGQTTNGSATSTSTQTAEVQTGIDLNLAANVDEGTIFTEVKLKADELNQFNAFTALGTQLKLPDTSAREISTTVRSRAGDIVLLGGITVARDEQDRSGLPLSTDSLLPTIFSRDIQRSELIIVLRPRIIRFGGVPKTPSSAPEVPETPADAPKPKAKPEAGAVRAPRSPLPVQETPVGPTDNEAARLILPMTENLRQRLNSIMDGAR